MSALAAIVVALPALAQDPDFQIYLCFGQSNMEGVGTIEPQDTKVADIPKNLKVMNCGNTEMGRELYQWRTALPPIVRYNTQLSVADYFGRTMAESQPDKKIGLVPVAVGGSSIKQFFKEYDGSDLGNYADWFRTAMSKYNNNMYSRLVDCAKRAQEKGVIKGIIMHQGEANNGDTNWPNDVKKVYNDLLADLGLNAEDVPLIAGEVVYTEAGGGAGGHNTIINSLPTIIPTAHVVSAARLTQKGDTWHFSSEAYREFGRRYARTMLSLLEGTPATPYTGAEVNASGTQDFYLYNVSASAFIRDNNRNAAYWTTRAEIANEPSTGYDFGLIKVDGGYQIDPKCFHNHSLNGSNLFMDTEDAVTVWDFEPVESTDGKKYYRIKAVSGPNGATYPYYLGVVNSYLAPCDADNRAIWQLVTKEERLQVMQANAGKNNGLDGATWLIPWNDFSRVDERFQQWHESYYRANTSGTQSTVDRTGLYDNSVYHLWHNVFGYYNYVTLTGLPNGTYQVRVQGFTREDWNNSVTWRKYAYGHSSFDKASYFAGAASNKFLQIADQEVAEPAGHPDNQTWQTVNIPNVGQRRVCDNPNSASRALTAGAYYNPWITAVVTDGTLTIGVYKPEGINWDWFIYDNFEMRYLGPQTDDATTDATDINEMLAIAKKYPGNVIGINDKIAAVENAATMSAKREAFCDLIATMTAVYTPERVKNIDKTFENAVAEELPGVDDIKAEYAAATTVDAANKAVKRLKYARRRAAAELHENVFLGNVPANGDFFLYNVGQKQFLVGGVSWGGHASVGYPGIEVTLEDGTDDGFYIDSHLYNCAFADIATTEYHYFNDGGWLDTKDKARWKFEAAGEDGVYYMKNAAGKFMAFRGNLDANDETNVGVIDNGEGNPDAMWKLVTRDERMALTTTATGENPADLSFMIKCPNVERRIFPTNYWTVTNASVWDYNNSHYEYSFESWNKNDFDIHQVIENLPAGYYAFQMQGYYRSGWEGDFVDHLSNLTSMYVEEESNVAEAAANDTETPPAPASEAKPIVSVLEGSGVSPDETDYVVYAKDGKAYDIPNRVNVGGDLFKLGKFKNELRFRKVGADSNIRIGVKKEKAEYTPDWTVMDNFRIKYLGSGDPSGIGSVAAEKVAEDPNAPIYNLQGIRVENPETPGIYIQNGKKFVVR